MLQRGSILKTVYLVKYAQEGRTNSVYFTYIRYLK